MPRPSAILTVWSSAWLAGSAALDDVLDALQPWARYHQVHSADPGTAAATTLPMPPAPATSITFLLAALRRASGGAAAGRPPGGIGPGGIGPGGIRLVLPAPGDVRGLPGPGAFSSAAMAEGEGIVYADAGLGIVPVRVPNGMLRWTVFPLRRPVHPAEFLSVPDAERELRGQVRRSTSILTELGVARHRQGVREEIAALLRARPQASWPAGMPSAALRLLQLADEVEAILGAARLDEPGGAVSASAANARHSALRPLETAVRVARRAAVAAYSPVNAQPG